jgi:ABC-type antimicrobial peptide transport system permease subunit
MHITTIYGDKRNIHEIVGVAKDARTHRLRGDVPPRYFVPVTQPLGEFSSLVFSIRTASVPESTLAAVKRAIRDTDPTLPLIHAQPLEERLATRTAQDRIMARLALAFACVAIGLAALGLYGVLSYGVVRRRSEIGIRMALGADTSRVVRMILRETSAVVVAGVVIGAGLAFSVARFLTNQLYGLTPSDPRTAALAIGILVFVATVAAYLPAHRAARLNPMVALRQE